MEEAEKCLLEANKLAPNKDYVIHRLAQARLRKGSPTEASVTYEQIPSHRRTPYILHGMAQCDIAQGHFEDAAKRLYLAIKREPQKFYHHWEFGLALEKLGATKQAVEAFETANQEFKREYGKDYRKAVDKVERLQTASGESKTIVFEEAPKDVAQINNGKIVKYNSQRGFGFVRDDVDGRDIFFHITAIKGRIEPPIGARVRFVREQGPKGPQAARVSLV
jgi:CspA family cold shock protein